MTNVQDVTDSQTIAKAGPRRELLRPFAAYFALGDSMSMDIYPRYDARDKDGMLGHADGAATLLHMALGLTATAPGEVGYRVFQNLTEDGATCKDLGAQIARINPERFGLRKGEPVLISITAGGNDLLRALPLQSFNAAVQEMDDAIGHLSHAIFRLERQLPDNPLTILLGNVYDPTDGTGELFLHGTSLDVRMQLRYLDYWNKNVFEAIENDRAIEGPAPGRLDVEILPVNIWGEFFGHGANGRLGVGARLGDLNRCHTPRFWYWSRSWIEPGVEGAIRLAGLWWKTATKEKARGPLVDDGTGFTKLFPGNQTSCEPQD